MSGKALAAGGAASDTGNDTAGPAASALPFIFKETVLMPPRAIVWNLDQLSRRCLGCYGHEWIETPNLDRLAARGVVFDQCFASPAEDSPLRDATAGWLERLQPEGVSVRCLSEADEPAADGEEDLNKTSLAQLVHQAEQALMEFSREPSASWLLWLESRGIGWPGLATSQFVELYADELDDVPADLVALREIEVAYAALLTQFDHFVGQLLATIERLFGEAPPLLVFMAQHGQSVGEAEMLSPFANRPSESRSDIESFRDELVHPPLLIAGAIHDPLGSRRSELVTPADVVPTLCDWFGRKSATEAQPDERSASDEVEPRPSGRGYSNLPLPDGHGSEDTLSRSLLPLLQNTGGKWRSELFLQDDDGGAAVRTADFYLIQPESAGPLDEGESSGSLFLKPEDAWEVNDVAEQYPEQVAVLRTMLRDWQRMNPAAGDVFADRAPQSCVDSRST